MLRKGLKRLLSRRAAFVFSTSGLLSLSLNSKTMPEALAAWHQEEIQPPAVHEVPPGTCFSTGLSFPVPWCYCSSDCHVLCIVISVLFFVV